MGFFSQIYSKVNTSNAAKWGAPTSTNREPSKWYKGDQPTWSEAVGRAFQIGQTDPEQGKKLMSDLNYLRSDPSSMYYNVYSQPTNRAANKLAANGFNTDLLTNGWLNSSDAAGYIRSNLVYDGATNTPKAPGKKSTADQYNAMPVNHQ